MSGVKETDSLYQAFLDAGMSPEEENPHKEFNAYGVWKQQLAKMDVNQLATEVSNDVYEAAMPIFEALEHLGIIRGNGHHIAQDIAQYASDVLRKRFCG